MKERIDAIRRFRATVRNNHETATATEWAAANACDDAVLSSECYKRHDEAHMTRLIEAAEAAIAIAHK